MLRPLFSKVAGRSLALTSESCDGLARQQSEKVWASQMSSMKLSSHSSRNAKLRPISKRKLSSFRRSLKGGSARIADSNSTNALSFSGTSTEAISKSGRGFRLTICGSSKGVISFCQRSECEVKILLLFVAAACRARWTLNYHLSTSNYLTSAHVDGRSLNPMVNQRSANAASTAIKAMPTVTETTAPNGEAASRDIVDALQ